MTDDGAPTVVVVDDNEPIADTYAAFLPDEYEVRTAYGGREALDVVDSTVDVVLLDRRMPDLSGDEVLEELDRRAVDPRVVMLTAVDPTPDIVDMAFDAYVVKPVQRADVTSVVDEMLDRATYDDGFRRFLSLVSKKAALEREFGSAELEASEKYEWIETRLAEMRNELGIETDDVEGIFDGSVPDIDAADVADAGRESVSE